MASRLFGSSAHPIFILPEATAHLRKTEKSSEDYRLMAGGFLAELDEALRIEALSLGFPQELVFELGRDVEGQGHALIVLWPSPGGCKQLATPVPTK